MTLTLDYHALAPEMILAVTVLVVLAVDFSPLPKYWSAVTALLGVVAAAIPVLTLGFCDHLGFCSDAGARELFSGSYVVDDFALVLKGAFLLGGFLALLQAVPYLESDRFYQGEFYFLLVASLLGAVAIASSRDLVTIFVSLELVTAPAFLMAGWRKGDLRSNEAALKFFIMGVVAAATILFGMSLVYGATGELTFDGIRVASAGLADEPLFILGVVFILLGFAFKLPVMPFHAWAPDAYQGMPVPLAAYLTISKGSGVVGILALCFLAFSNVTQVWAPVLFITAVASMTVANFSAIKQTHVVRLLGFSSIAHGGFVIAPLAVVFIDGVDPEQAFFAAVTYYLVYLVMNLGAFAAVGAAVRKTGSAEMSDWAGMATYAPGIATLTGVFFFALAGIPPLAGWFAKLVMFKAVLQGVSGWGVALAVIAAVNSVVALYYYARVVKTMWMDPAPEAIDVPAARERRTAPSLGLAMGLTAVAVLVIGVYPRIVEFFGEMASVLAAGGQ